MSTTSLPSYVAPPAFHSQRTPSYTAEPQAFEQRLALNRPARRPSGNFVKQAKNVSLRLFAQENNATLPTYGCGAAVEGEVSLSKTDGVTAVEVKVRPVLRSGTPSPVQLRARCRSAIADRREFAAARDRGGWDDDVQALLDQSRAME